MDLVVFDGSHNGVSSTVDTEVEEGRPVCGVEGKLALRNKMMTMKQKMKVIKKEKSISSDKKHMQLAVGNVD
ncbi:hypothetical protein PVK06_036179 [Gossypium arboreum]|uniref:Uncharacterized protein n=1 Tax=Gossypium arboreum TaxID=29729 RepID=A0ABR0NL78_GOSAR|nr:hypothetical protein PVK06_036179 [Gossypium arboreum]